MEKQKVQLEANQCYRQTLKYAKNWNSAGTAGGKRYNIIDKLIS